MVALIAGLFYLLVLPPLQAADAPLSFNLERMEDRHGDYPLVFYKFRCGSKSYVFCPPAAWKISGDATSMLFSNPTAAGDVSARFRVSSSTELALLDPTQSARREHALRQNLPEGLTDLQEVRPEDMRPAPFPGHNGIEIVYRFNFFGRALEASVMLCQLDEKNGFTLVMIAPAGIKENFIAQVRVTLGAVGVDEDKSGISLH